MDKLKQLLRKVPSLSPVSFRQAPNENHGEAGSRPSIESTREPIVVAGPVAATHDADNEHVWVSANKNTLLMTDKKVLLMTGISLTDKHINYAQALLKQQFTCVGGLQSTLFQYRPLQNKFPEGIQIIHSHGCHWVVAHKRSCSSDVVKAYDSLYDEVDNVVREVITNLFLFCDPLSSRWSPCRNKPQIPTIVVFFAVAVCVAILLKENPGAIIFKEDQMRPHMCSCFEQKVMINFHHNKCVKPAITYIHE